MSLDLELYFEVDTGGKENRRLVVYDGNITHNVSAMWNKANVYNVLYGSNGARCGDYLEQLQAGIAKMIAPKSEFEKLNPANGWGNYKVALDFLIEFTQAVAENPNAIIEADA